jgi:hypothetical protein
VPGSATGTLYDDTLLFVSGMPVSVWTVVVATATLPAIWIAGRTLEGRQRRARREAGRCPLCGFDLRASPERCPEFGLPVADRPREAAA